MLEKIWANNYVASAVMSGTWSTKTPYIEDANISTLTTSGEPKRIQAVIGIKTETWKNLTADIAKNATGQTTYTVVEVKQKQKLTLISGLMRAVPWRHVDPPSLSAVLSSIVRAAAQTLKTAWRSLVNTLTAAMTTVRSILAGAAVAMRAGISLLKAGIMAAIGFLSKLFSDGSLLLREFGQQLVGALSEAADKAVKAFKSMLYWLSWIWAKTIEIILVISRQVLSLIAQRFRVENEYVMAKIRIIGDAPLHIEINTTLKTPQQQTMRLHGEGKIYVEERHIECLDTKLWCVVSDGYAEINEEKLLEFEAAQAVGIPVVWSVQTPTSQHSKNVDSAAGVVSSGSYILRGIGNGYDNLRKMLIQPALELAIGAITAITIGGLIVALRSTDPTTMAYGWGAYINGILAAIQYLPIMVLGYASILTKEKMRGALYALALDMAILNCVTGITMVFLSSLLPAPDSEEAPSLVIGIIEIVLGVAMEIIDAIWGVIPWFLDILGYALLIYGIFETSISFGVLLFPDVMEMPRETVFVVGVGMFLVALYAVSLMLLAPVYSMFPGTKVDLEPPEIAFSPADNITVDSGTNRLCFSYLASDEEHGDSRILGTAVALLRTPTGSDEMILPKLNPFSGGILDPLSGVSYSVEIPLKNIDGKQGTSDDNGLVDVTATGIEEADLATETTKGDTVWEVRGNFTFRKYPNGTLKIHRNCKYYLVIVAVDYYGNAYWEIWNVTDYVHRLANQPATRTPEKGRPRIWTQNLGGKVEPEGVVSHYYTLMSGPYVPWIRTGGGKLQRCFTLIVAPSGHMVRIVELNVTISQDAEAAGIFVLRCYELWQFGLMRILVDGAEFAVIVFAYTVGPWTLFALLLPLLLVAVAAVLSRRYGVRGS